MTLKPASVNTGVVFVRTDVDNSEIKVGALRVTETQLCTKLTNGYDVSVSTIEHIMAALRAMDIDNVRIELNNEEIPILDGSSIVYMRDLRKVGTVAQSGNRQVIRILDTIEFQDGDKSASLTPCRDAMFSFDIDFSSKAIGRQSYSMVLGGQAFYTKLAKARTFGFLHEIEHLQSLGLCRGGAIDNAVVIDGDEIINPEGLRYPDEFVRHKILDAIGDLFVIGSPIIGHYHGVRAGHGVNNKLLRVLLDNPQAWRYEVLGEASDAQPINSPAYIG